MKNRKQIINKLVNEGLSEKFLSGLNDKQLTDLSERLLSEQTLNIPKDDNQAIEKAKQDNKTFVTYEEDQTEIDEESDCDECSEVSEEDQEEINEWVEGLVKDKYYPGVTTKEEIFEMIGALSDTADRLVAAKDMFDVDEQSPAPSKPDVDTPTREKPSKPSRENPFKPKHKPKPKAKLPKVFSFDSIGIELKQAAE
jgi:hypothetical protein